MPMPMPMPPAALAADAVDTAAAHVEAGSGGAEPAAVVAAAAFWVQLGAFRVRDGAESFRRRVVAELGWLAPLLGVVDDAPMFRLQAGPYASRDEARGVAARVRDGLQLVPVIVERR